MELTDLKVTRYQAAEGVATITLVRPERLNAWTGRMHTEYRALLARAADDTAVRVIVVTGAGRGFCAGADTRALEGHVERGGYDPGTPPDLARPGYGVRPEFDADFAYHFGVAKPVIAAVNGAAAGVGFALACYCDLRFAAAGAKLTTAHGRLGLPAEYGLSWLLPRLIGLTRAADLLLSSRVVLAEEARELGLVNRVEEPDELMEATYAYARTLATEVSPASLAATKLQMYLDLHRDAATAVRDSADRLDAMMTGGDFHEGVAALAERRLPHFADPRPAAHTTSATGASGAPNATDS
jgi:enoyl-CoA hydratase/carnithine racemase